ncbi:phospholipid-transporting ATPase [Enteropsectra breve]|nr:phospholipid-transporting ATPase [Enteropsectra breve]
METESIPQNRARSTTSATNETRGRQTILENFNSLLHKHPNRIVSSKYTILNFLPLNLYHQFSKPSTIFFLITLILLFIPAISPFEPWSYLIAFMIVVGISMIKDALEDYKRHVSDRQINNMECTIIRTSGDNRAENNAPRHEEQRNAEAINEGALNEQDGLKRVKVEDIKNGDWLLVSKNEEIHADCILIRSQSYKSKKHKCTNYCFINTASLDGESNLKRRSAPVFPELGVQCPIEESGEKNRKGKMCECFERVRDSVESFKVEDTGDSFSDFDCELRLKRNENSNGNIAANDKNAVLRGSILKNTEWAIFLVVAVGKETKQCKSVNRARKGRSLFDKRMDFMLLIIATIYFIMLACTTAVGITMRFSNDNIKSLAVGSAPKEVVRLIFSNYILYSYLIPLSLYVMIEVARFFNSNYIKFDRKLQLDDKTAICRNSNVIEDLGTIDYILTDKTGTITKNSMTLKAFHLRETQELKSCNSVFESQNLSKNSDNKEKQSDEKIDLKDNFNLLMLNILVCNSVEVLDKKYEGISQEELCFLEEIEKYGFTLLERDPSFVKIKFLGKELKIHILNTVEFSSKRQCMSCVVLIEGKIFLFVKGSDSKLLGNNNKDNEKLIDLLNRASDYRSLVIKCREISTDEAYSLLNRINKNEEFVDSEKANDKNANSINEDADGGDTEKLVQMINPNSTEDVDDIIDGWIDDAEYVGSTFIEDELQDGVKSTMEHLRDAGMRIWMITGDKKETAVSCGKNSKIIVNDSYLEIEGRDIVSRLEEASGITPNARHSEQPGSNSRDIFGYSAAIIYRATPKQKGRIAELLVKANKNVLGIGDGNNDVAMLKDSHVGVGIMGKEGTQASLAADFAIPEFKGLKRLIMVHGRYNLIRYSKIALNAFYKNLIFIMFQFFYNFFNGGSGRAIYNDFFMNYYNLFFTSLVPFTIALFDRDRNEESIYEHPRTYQCARAYFHKKIIFWNVAYAVLEAAALYFVLYGITHFDVTNGAGKPAGYMCLSTFYSVVIFTAVIINQYSLISYFVWYSYAAVSLSVVLNLVMLFGLQNLSVDSNKAILHILAMPINYLILIGMLCVIFMSEGISRLVKQQIMEGLIQEK